MNIMGEQTMDNGHAPTSRTLTSSSPNAASHHHDPSNNHSNGRSNTQYSYEYLSQLIKDKKQLEAFPNVFHHLERLADEEISKVRMSLFQFEFAKDAMSNLPDAKGDVTTMTEKIFVPVKEHPDYNFVGRILGPRGMTTKQLEQETGCRIMVLGKGSMRDRAKEEANRGKPNWEHLAEDLHVLIRCEDSSNRAAIKLKRAAAEVRKLLVPFSDDDELKRKQLMELSIINGTYRSGNATQTSAAHAVAVTSKTSLAALRTRLMAPMPLSVTQVRKTALVVSEQQQNAVAANAFTQQAAVVAAANPAMSGMPAHLLQPQALIQGYYAQLCMNSIQYDPTTGGYAVPLSSAAAANIQQQQYAAAAAAAMFSASPYLGHYSTVDLSHAGAVLCNQRRVLGQSREHPYGTGKGSTS